MSKRIELPRYERCFVCGEPAVNSKSLKLRSYLEDGEVKAVFVPQAEHVGYPEIVHGGILACPPLDRLPLLHERQERTNQFSQIFLPLPRHLQDFFMSGDRT